MPASCWNQSAATCGNQPTPVLAKVIRPADALARATHAARVRAGSWALTYSSQGVFDELADGGEVLLGIEQRPVGQPRIGRHVAGRARAQRIAGGLGPTTHPRYIDESSPERPSLTIFFASPV